MQVEEDAEFVVEDDEADGDYEPDAKSVIGDYEPDAKSDSHKPKKTCDKGKPKSKGQLGKGNTAASQDKMAQPPAGSSESTQSSASGTKGLNADMATDQVSLLLTTINVSKLMTMKSMKQELNCFKDEMRLAQEWWQRR